jgi:hypothetical protein
MRETIIRELICSQTVCLGPPNNADFWWPRGGAIRTFAGYFSTADGTVAAFSERECLSSLGPAFRARTCAMLFRISPMFLTMA